jgi:hypothetical protein
MSPSLLAHLSGIRRQTFIVASGRDLPPEWREVSPVSDFYRPCELLARGFAF